MSKVSEIYRATGRDTMRRSSSRASAASSCGYSGRSFRRPATWLLLLWVVAAMVPVTETAESSEPMSVSDSDIALGDTTDALLATGLVERITPTQFAAREKGYLSAEYLSGVQLTAARRIGQRHGLLDEQGLPTEANTHLCIGLRRKWEVHVSAVEGESTRWFKLDVILRPPTPEAVLVPPLPSTALRSSWPYPAPSAGVKAVLQSLNTMGGKSRSCGIDAVGWHLRDLPLLYRNWIGDAWDHTRTAHPEMKLPVLDSRTADVLWVNAVLVAVALQEEDGSGVEVEFSIPAF